MFSPNADLERVNLYKRPELGPAATMISVDDKPFARLVTKSGCPCGDLYLLHSDLVVDVKELTTAGLAGDQFKRFVIYLHDEVPVNTGRRVNMTFQMGSFRLKAYKDRFLAQYNAKRKRA